MNNYLKPFLLILIVITIGLLYSSFNKRGDQFQKTDSPAETLGDNTTSLNIDYAGQNLTASWIEVKNAETIFLYPNFSEKLTSQEAYLKDNCSQLVNGSFYTKDERPIALFISEGQLLRNANSNKLANGFFTITSEGKAKISSIEPDNNIRVGIQTGPLLIVNNSVQAIASSNGENARRIAVGLTIESKIVFFVIYQNSSAFLGPKLADLPQILKLVSEKADLHLQDAVNLDGGSASAFYKDGETLSELSFIGSYFCIKNE